MEKKEYFEELQKLEDQFYSISSHFNTNFPKVLNLKEERTKFFNAIHCKAVYNPQLLFEKVDFNLEKLEELKNLKISGKNDLYNFKKLLKERIKSKISEINSHIHWGEILSSDYVRNYRGEASYILLLKAKQFCSNYKREKIKCIYLEPEFIAEKLKTEVMRLTNNLINVEFCQISSKVNIIPHLNLIKINPNEKFSNLDLDRLLVHEIGVHYMRYYNAKKLGIKLLEIGSSNYIKTEEGLAVYAECIKGVNSKSQMFIYAGRVIASYYTLRRSFYEIYNILKKYGFSNDIAFKITFRAKRNISDTSLIGGYTKDYVYFKGYDEIKKYLKTNDIRDLFIGKIKIKDVKLLRKFIDENKKGIETIF